MGGQLLLKEDRDGLGVETEDLISIRDVDVDLAVAVGLRKAKLSGKQDLTQRRPGNGVDDGDAGDDVRSLRRSARGSGLHASAAHRRSGCGSRGNNADSKEQFGLRLENQGAWIRNRGNGGDNQQVSTGE